MKIVDFKALCSRNPTTTTKIRVLIQTLNNSPHAARSGGEELESGLRPDLGDLLALVQTSIRSGQ
jgi:hypothetical protein